MAVRAGAVIVDFIANTAKFSLNMRKAEKTVTSASARMNRALAGVRNASSRMGRELSFMAKRFLGVGAGIGALLGTAGLSLLAKKALDVGDAIAKAADRIGISTTALQEYRHASDLAGLSTEENDKALEAYTRRLGEARAGTGTLVTFLNKYDKTLLQNITSARSSEEALQLIFRAMDQAKTAADRAALGYAAFGRQGQKMALLLKGGVAALEATRAQAHELGLVIEEDLLRNAESAKDKLSILSRVISAQFNKAMLSAAPAIGELATAFTKLVPKIVNATLAFFKFIGLVERSPVEALKKKLEVVQEAQNGFQIFPGVRVPVSGKQFEENKRTIEGIKEQIRFYEEANRAAERYRQSILNTLGGAGAGGGGRGGTSKVTQAMKDSTKAVREHLSELERLKSAGKAVFEATRTPLEKYNAEVERLNMLVDAGAINQDTFTRALKAAQDEFDRADDKVNRLRDSFAEVGQIATSALERITFESGKARDVVQQLLTNLARVIYRDVVAQPLERGIKQLLNSIVSGTQSSGGNFHNASDVGTAAAVPGYATGGSFTVGGAGGTDSQVVPIRATPGETVTVSTPAQQRTAGNGVTINNFLTFNNVNGRDEITRVVNEAFANIRPAWTQGAVDQMRDDQARSRKFLRGR